MPTVPKIQDLFLRIEDQTIINRDTATFVEAVKNAIIVFKCELQNKTLFYLFYLFVFFFHSDRNKLRVQNFIKPFPTDRLHRKKDREKCAQR